MRIIFCAKWKNLYSKIQNVDVFMRYGIHFSESIVEVQLNIRIGAQKYQLKVYWIISIFDLLMKRDEEWNRAVSHYLVNQSI